MARLITLDFDPIVEAADVPEGTYKVQVLEANQKTSSTGNPMIELVMGIVDDPQHSGRKLFDNISLIPKAAWKLVQACHALGTDSRRIDLDDWVGRQMWVDVALEKDSGRSRPMKYRER